MNMVNKTQVPAYMLIRQYVMEMASCAENNGKKIMSIRELCELYGVSHTTVLKALQELIREGVLIAKPGMGTFINSKASTPFADSSPSIKQIGLIVQTGNRAHYDQYHLKLISGVFDVLSEKGVFIQLITLPKLDESFPDILKTMNIDGIVWVNPDSECRSCIDAIDKAGFPMLTVTIDHPELLSKHSVASDFFQAGHLAGTHLLKEGHRKILHISNENKKSKRTIEGLKAAYKENNLSIRDEYFLEGGEKLLERVEIMIDIGFQFSAIFADGNFCLSLYELLKKKNIRVPEDVTIVAMEDTFLKPSDFKFTFVRCPLKQMGKKTGEHLVELIKDRKTNPMKTVLNWEI